MTRSWLHPFSLMTVILSIASPAPAISASINCEPWFGAPWSKKRMSPSEWQRERNMGRMRRLFGRSIILSLIGFLAVAPNTSHPSGFRIP